MGLSSTPAPKAKKEFPADVPMPLGTQDATVTFAMVKANKDGLPIYSIKFADVAERTAWANLHTTEKALPYTEKKLTTLLGDSADVLQDDETSPEDICALLLGKTATITVVDEEYQGKTYRKVSWIN